MPSIPVLLIYNKYNDNMIKVILHDENMTAEERLIEYVAGLNKVNDYQLNIDDYYAVETHVELTR